MKHARKAKWTAILGLAVAALAGATPLVAQDPAEQAERARLERLRMEQLEVERRLREVMARLRTADVEALRTLERRIAEIQERRAGLGERSSAERALPASSVPAPWLEDDPADSLYRAAREELSGGRYARAAELFADIRSRYPDSGYVGDSYYFQALALERAGGESRLRQALELLGRQLSDHAGARTTTEARTLRVRLEAALARTGNPGSAEFITRLANQECGGPEEELRVTALSALLRMDPERARPLLVEVLSTRDRCSGELRRQALFMLAQDMDDDVLDILIDVAFRNPDPDEELRSMAALWLSKSDALDVAELGDLYRSVEEPELKEQILMLLGDTPDDPEVVTLLMEIAGSDESPGLRQRAVIWLGRSEDPRVAPFLVELLRGGG